jgi:hypothetical protein
VASNRPASINQRRARHRGGSRRVSLAGAVVALAIAHPAAAEQGGPLPPLTESDRVAMEASTDGVERREESWVRLLDHAATWPRDPRALSEAIAASPIVQRPDWPAWLADPDLQRGTLVRLSGRLEQATAFPWPSTHSADAPRLAEWFVRPDAREGDPQTSGAVQVWVVDPPALAPDRAPRRVEVVGRFLRVTELEGRDGVRRAFPTVVGVAVPVAEAPAGWGRGGIVALLVVAMIPIVIWLRRLAKRPVRPARLMPSGEMPADDRRRDLPTDPAQALAVLEHEAAREGSP